MKNRDRHIFDALPYGSQNGLDVLPNLDDVGAELIHVNARPFKQASEQGVVALHEVDEILHQQSNNDDFCRHQKNFFVDSL